MSKRILQRFLYVVLCLLPLAYARPEAIEGSSLCNNWQVEKNEQSTLIFMDMKPSNPAYNATVTIVVALSQNAGGISSFSICTPESRARRNVQISISSDLQRTKTIAGPPPPVSYSRSFALEYTGRRDKEMIAKLPQGIWHSPTDEREPVNIVELMLKQRRFSIWFTPKGETSSFHYYGDLSGFQVLYKHIYQEMFPEKPQPNLLF